MINYNLETHDKLSCLKMFLIFILKFNFRNLMSLGREFHLGSDQLLRNFDKSKFSKK